LSGEREKIKNAAATPYSHRQLKKRRCSMTQHSDFQSFKDRIVFLRNEERVLDRSYNRLVKRLDFQVEETQNGYRDKSDFDLMVEQTLKKLISQKEEEILNCVHERVLVEFEFRKAWLDEAQRIIDELENF
jgi:hypothetical protein